MRLLQTVSYSLHPSMMITLATIVYILGIWAMIAQRALTSYPLPCGIKSERTIARLQGTSSHQVLLCQFILFVLPIDAASTFPFGTPLYLNVFIEASEAAGHNGVLSGLWPNFGPHSTNKLGVHLLPVVSLACYADTEVSNVLEWLKVCSHTCMIDVSNINQSQDLDSSLNIIRNNDNAIDSFYGTALNSALHHNVSTLLLHDVTNMHFGTYYSPNTGSSNAEEPYTIILIKAFIRNVLTHKLYQQLLRFCNKLLQCSIIAYYLVSKFLCFYFLMLEYSIDSH